MAKNPVIKTYQWDDSSLVPQVDFRIQEGGCIAYLYAHEDAENSPEQQAGLKAIRDIIKQNGWVTSSDLRDGRPVLRLMGPKNPEELTKILQEGGWAKGEVKITGADLDVKPKTLMESIKQGSLKFSGIVCSIGNAMYFAEGVHRNKFEEKNKKSIFGLIGASLAWGMGDAALALFGGKDDERQFKVLLEGLKNHLAKQGITPPAHSAIDEETKPKESTWEKIHDFMYKQANAVKALTELVAGAFYVIEGNKINITTGKKDRLRQAAGVIFGLGFGSSLVVKEEKPDPEKLKNAGPLEKAWAWWKEKPLRVSGLSGYSNTILTTWSGIKEMKAHKLNPNSPALYGWKFATPSVMLFGNGLYAMSSKNTGGAITEGDLVKDVYGIAAQVLNHVPLDKREAAIQSTVDFLGSNTTIKESREEVDKLLRAEVDRLKFTNPWFKVANKEQFVKSSSEAEQERTPDDLDKKFASDALKKKNVLTSPPAASMVEQLQNKAANENSVAAGI